MTIQQFKLIRLYLGMPQNRFSEYIGVAESTVAKIEAGFSTVSDVTKARVLRRFDITAPEFMEFCERMKIGNSDNRRDGLA